MPHSRSLTDRGVRPLMVLGIMLAFLAVMAAASFWAGQVQGVEFSPTHFRIRRFKFFELPLVHLQLTPILRSDVSNDTATHLTATSLIDVPAGPPSRWDLTSMTRGGDRRPDDSSLLVNLLQNRTGGKEVWHQWSLDHPAAAARLWPTIASLARRRLYVVIPEAMVAARDSTDVHGDDAPALSAAVDPVVQRLTRTWITDLRAAGLGTLADEIEDPNGGDPPR